MTRGPLTGFGGLAFFIACIILGLLAWILLRDQHAPQTHATTRLRCDNCRARLTETEPTTLDLTEPVYCTDCAADMETVRGLVG